LPHHDGAALPGARLFSSFRAAFLVVFCFRPRPRWIELIFVFDIRAALLGIIRNSDFVLIFSAQFPPFKPTSAPSSFFPAQCLPFCLPACRLNYIALNRICLVRFLHRPRWAISRLAKERRANMLDYDCILPMQTTKLV
jgi:hypothetical protein